MPQPRAEAVFKKGALSDDVTAKSVHIQLIPGDQRLEPITTVATCSSIRLQVSPVPKPWHRIHALSLRTFNNPQDRLHSCTRAPVRFLSHNMQDPIHWARSVTTSPLCCFVQQRGVTVRTSPRTSTPLASASRFVSKR
jgi:hypothetical protein